jgi:cell division septation protein DedD
MRFFTNENKDDGTDPKDVDIKDRDTHHADSTDSSDTVALPQQRGNSPWSSTPDTGSATDATGIHRRDDDPLIEDPTPPDHAVADTSPDATAPVAGDAGSRDTDPAWAGPTGDDPSADGKGATLKDDGGFDDPKVVVDPADTAEPEPVPVAAQAAVPDAPVTTGTPSGDAKPGEIPAADVTTIFGADDAKAFQERWRDVQLRFVDSPKEATAEAATLVDDAVEKLTASLRGQKESFGGDSAEDTEKLRVELRGYRDLFNRIIGL